MEVRGQQHAPAALPPERPRHPLNRSLRGPQNQSGRLEKRTKLSPAGIRTPNLLSWPIHYTEAIEKSEGNIVMRSRYINGRAYRNALTIY